eukprot:gene1294-2503_t
MSISSSYIKEGERSVKWNVFNNSIFATASLNKIELYDIKHQISHEGIRIRNATVLKPSKESPSVSCIEWSQIISKPLYLAYGCSSGSVNLIDWDSKNEFVINSSSKYRIPCTELAWNSQISSRLATGFVSQRTEYSAVVWDVEVQCGGKDDKTDKNGGIIYEVSRDATASMVWIPQSFDLLAVGTFTGWVRVYDLRSPNEATINVMAHIPTRPRRVRGVRPDPFNEHYIATFSDFPGEPVKVWDLRKVSKSNATPSLVIDATHSHSSEYTSIQQNTNSAVMDVAWSTSRPSLIAVASSHSKKLPFFSVSKPMSTDGSTIRTPVFSITVDHPMKSLSWSSHTSHLISTSSKDTIDMLRRDVIGENGDVLRSLDTSTSLFGNRLLVGTSSGCLDLAVHERIPLAISAANDLIFGGGCLLKLTKIIGQQSTSTSISKNTSDVTTPHRASSKLTQPPPTSLTSSLDVNGVGMGIEEVMKRRCLSGYSMDPVKNLQILYLEHDALEKRRKSSLLATQQLLSSSSSQSMNIKDLSIQHHHQKQLYQLSTPQQLSRVWSWVERIQQPTCFYPQSSSQSSAQKLSLSLCGAMQIIVTEGGDANKYSKGSKSNMNMNMNVNSNRSGGCNNENTVGMLHTAIGCTVYSSSRRCTLRMACGWTDITGLDSNGGGRGSGDHNDDDDEDDDGYNALTQLIDDSLLQDIQLAVGILQSMVEIDNSSNNNNMNHFTATTGIENDPPRFRGNRARLGSDNFSDSGGESESSSIHGRGRERGGVGGEESDFTYTNHKDDDDMIVMMEGHSSGRRPGVGEGDEDDDDGSDSVYIKPCIDVTAVEDELTPDYLSVLALYVDEYVSTCHHSTGITHCHQFLLELAMKSHPPRGGGGGSQKHHQHQSPSQDISEKHKVIDNYRVAFAATYLKDPELIRFITALSDSYQASGDLEGLVVTGLGAEGTRLLQKYVDMNGDVQTVALLQCQIGIGDPPADSDLPNYNWLMEYRQLLNRWQMFIERAELDVALSHRYRELSTQSSNTNNPSSSANTDGGGGGGGGGTTSTTGGGGGGGGTTSTTGGGGGAPEGMGRRHPGGSGSGGGRGPGAPPSGGGGGGGGKASGPSSTSLPVDAFQKQNQTSTTLRRLKPIMTCCPHCKQPLPRCYVCLLYMGLVNPQIELKMALRRKSHTSSLINSQTDNNSTTATTKNKNNDLFDDCKDQSKYDLHNVLTTGNWFMWCQSCKHGGHGVLKRAKEELRVRE